jgi:hypothetical protein
MIGDCAVGSTFVLVRVLQLRRNAGCDSELENCCRDLRLKRTSDPGRFSRADMCPEMSTELHTMHLALEA